MAFDINNLVIDRVLRGTLFDKATNEVLFTADQITDPSLECSGEQVFSNDALGAKIATFDRSKDAKFSANNALINLGLAAAQFGSTKVVGASAAKITTPKFEIFTVGAVAGTPNTTFTLAEIPTGTSGSEVKYIYKLNTDTSLNTKYEVAATADSTHFSLVAATKVVTVPTGSLATDRFAVWYEYAEENAVSVSNNGTEFSKAGVFDLEILLADICNQSTKYYAHIVFGNCKLDNATTLNLTNTSNHSFSLTAMQDYCDPDKKFFEIIIPQ